MTKKEQETKSRIPEFKSREEEAEWFDTHDMADYQDEFKTVRARFAKNLSEGLNIRLDKDTLETIRTSFSVMSCALSAFSLPTISSCPSLLASARANSNTSSPRTMVTANRTQKTSTQELGIGKKEFVSPSQGRTTVVQKSLTSVVMTAVRTVATKKVTINEVAQSNHPLGGRQQWWRIAALCTELHQA